MILFALFYRSLLCPLAKVSSRVTSANRYQSRGTDRAAAASPTIPIGTPPSNASSRCAENHFCWSPKLRVVTSRLLSLSSMAVPALTTEFT